MIKTLLICDSLGMPFYSREFGDSPHIDETLLSGLISAIGSLGRTLFHEEIATISFGMNGEKSNGKSHIVVISKDLFFEDKSIYFVFFTEGDCVHSHMKEIATTIYIEIKNLLKHPEIVNNSIKTKVDQILINKFNDLRFC